MVDVVARGTADDWGLTRRSLISAVTAISTTSSPKRRPFGQPPGTVPPPNPAWTWLVSTSPPKMLRRENPASSGLGASVAPPPARRAGSVDKSTLIKSGMKIPTISVRFVVGATLPWNTSALIRAASSGFSAYLRNRSLSWSGSCGCRDPCLRGRRAPH